VADEKISAQADGTPIAPGDAFVVARGSSNVKIAGTGLVAIHDRESATIDVVNTLNETTIFTHSVPANELGTDRAIEVQLQGDLLENVVTGAQLTWRIYFGGTTIWNDVLGSVTAISASRRPWWLHFILAANGATNAQRLGGLFLLGTAGGATTGLGDIDTDEIESQTPLINNSIAIDSTVARTLEVTVDWFSANVNESVRRHYAHCSRW
jgi:hypothetical protein